MDANHLIGYFGGWIVAAFAVNILTLFIVRDIRKTQVEEKGKRGGD